MVALCIRDPLPDDAAAIARVHVETWRSAYRGQLPDEFLDGLSVEQRTRGWRRVIEEGDPEWPEMTVWVAEDAESVVGFCAVGPNRDADVGGAVGEVYAIYVDARHWDTGIGASLMNQALAWLGERYGEVTLWVLESNERGRRFYERGGWHPDGATKGDDRGSFVLHEVRYRVEL